MRAITVQIIAARKGWQCEIALPNGWTAYSRVYPTPERAEEMAVKFAKRLGYECEFERDTPTPPEEKR